MQKRLAALERLEAAAEAEQALAEQIVDETDADALDDDELLAEAWYGLRNTRDTSNDLSYYGGTLHATCSGSARARFWERVARRANGVPLFPLTVEEIVQALDAFDSGALWMRSLSPNCWKSHYWTVCAPYPDYGGTWHLHEAGSDLRALQESVAHALDQWVYQTGSPIWEDTGVVCAFLRSLLAEYDAGQRAAHLSELRSTLDMLDSGELYVRPFNPTQDLRQYGKQLHHSCWVRGAESGLYSNDPRGSVLECLRRALDEAQQRSSSAFCQSSDEARAVLLAEITALEESDHGPVQETA